jgi:dolichyl-phosphate beta-glucosyltransferase
VEISFVIPCYNEEKRLEPKLSETINFLVSRVKRPFEIIFVDDGSRDGTRRILGETKKNNPGINIEIIGYPGNKGKGHAVKTGVMHARGDKIIVMDADFSIDIGEVDKAVEKLDDYDIVVGTKKHLLTKSVKHQNAPRRILGKGFTVMTNVILGMSFSDITCGFKGFRSGAAKDIFSRQRMKRWAYDAETLFLVKRLKYRTVELPVRWHHIEGSKVSPLLDTVSSMKDLLEILSNYYLGRYKGS